MSTHPVVGPADRPARLSLPEILLWIVAAACFVMLLWSIPEVVHPAPESWPLLAAMIIVPFAVDLVLAPLAVRMRRRGQRTALVAIVVGMFLAALPHLPILVLTATGAFGVSWYGILTLLVVVVLAPVAGVVALRPVR